MTEQSAGWSIPAGAMLSKPTRLKFTCEPHHVGFFCCIYGVMFFGDLLNTRRQSTTSYYGFFAFMISTIGNVLSRARSAMRIKSKGQSRRHRCFYSAAAAAELLESRELLSVTSELVADIVQHDNRGSEIQQVTFGSEFA